MTTNFPSGLDAFTNPSATDAMDSVTVPHATQHADLNDAVEALQAKVGVDGSAVTTSLDYKLGDIGTWTNYTPTFSGFTGSVAVAQYCRVNKIVFVTMDIQITAVTGFMQVTLPIAAVHPYELNQGYGYALDAGSNIYWLRTTYGSSTQIYPSAMYTGNPYASYSTCAPTTPFTWANGDYFNLAISYEVA